MSLSRKLQDIIPAEATRTKHLGLACRDAMAESVEEMTPLKRKLDEFGTFLSKVLWAQGLYFGLGWHYLYILLLLFLHGHFYTLGGHDRGHCTDYA